MASDLTTLATCWILTRTDDTVMRFTDHDVNIQITNTADGVEGVYEAESGYTASSVSNNLDLSVDQLDVIGLLDSSGITEADIQAGLYDDAEIKIFMLNWQAPNDGIIKMRRGWLGEVKLTDGQFTAELRGMAQALQQTSGETYGPDCKATLGDSRCKVRVDPPAWQASTAYTERTIGAAETGSVIKPTSTTGIHLKCSTAGTSGGAEPSWNTTIDGTTNDGSVVWTTIRAMTVAGSVTNNPSDRKTFIDSALSMPDEWFEAGLVTWITGLNAGLTMEVKSFASNAFELALPMPYAITNTDTYNVTAGCRRRWNEDCVQKFDNHYNMRATPLIPGIDAINTFGGQ